MKKFLPLVICCMVFTGFLVGQILFDLMHTQAKLTDKEKTVMASYTQEAKKLKLKTVKDLEIDFSIHKAPVKIINFWAAWCTPCLQEFQSLVELKSKFSDDELLVVGINTDDEQQLKKIKEIETKYKLNFHNVADKNNEILDRFKISTLPVSIILINGKVYEISRKIKNFNDEKFVELIKNSIKQK